MDAQQALDKMNGFEIAGRPIRVGLVTEKGSSNPNMQNSNGPNMGGGGGMGMSMGMNGPGSMQGGPGGPRPANSGMMRPDNLEDGGAPLPYRYTAKIT